VTAPRGIPVALRASPRIPPDCVGPPWGTGPEGSTPIRPPDRSADPISGAGTSQDSLPRASWWQRCHRANHLRPKEYPAGTPKLGWVGGGRGPGRERVGFHHRGAGSQARSGCTAVAPAAV